MSKIIGVTVGTPTSPSKMAEELKPVKTVNGTSPDKNGNVKITAQEVGAEPEGTASAVMDSHETNLASHPEMRNDLEALRNRVNAALNSTDVDLDQLAEIVAYIKSNKTLIDAITTSKVSVSDIINNLTTNVANKPLSAAQGVALKNMCDALSASLANYQPKGNYALVSAIPTKVSQLQNDSGYLTQHQDISGKVDKTGLTMGYHTDGLLYLFVDGQPVGAGIELPAGGISGYVDSDNNIVINNLPDGSYTVKYELEDGSTIEIGDLVVGAAAPAGRLPAEYQEVEWVQINVASNQHSGIKTDLLWSGVDKIVTKVQNVESTNTNDMFFSTWNAETAKAAPFIATSGGNMCGAGSGLANYAVSPSDIVAANTDANTFTMTWNSSSPDGTIFFGSWQDDAYSNPHKWYFVEFYSGDTLVGEFVPCYRMADNVIGFYDTVGNKFYENAYPSEKFLKGADVVNSGTTEPGTPDAPTTDYTNLAEPNPGNTTDFTVWCTNARMSGDGLVYERDGYTCTNYFEVAQGDVIRIRGFKIERIGLYDANKNPLPSAANGVSEQAINNYIHDDYIQTDDATTFTVEAPTPVYARLSGWVNSTADAVIITRNEEIT